MENFDQKPKGVKEKNLYIVHLDTPRIIILSSVIIGIITASFLLGMSIIKKDSRQSSSLAVNDITFDENKEIDVLNRGIPALPDGDIEDGRLDEKAGEVNSKDSLIGLDGEKKESVQTEGSSEVAEIKKSDVDVLTKENISEIIPPASKVVKAKKSPAKKDRVVSKARTVKIDKKIAVRKKTQNRKSKVASSSGRSRVHEVSREADTGKSRRGYFSVQVASYDRLSKAEKERNQLKSRRFDAYIDRTVVNGRNFYRVRIGPLSSKSRAADLLNDVQRDRRYANSYMVKE